MFAVSRRSAVVERLRRVLFSPSKALAVGALALTFATAAPASGAELDFNPTQNVVVNAGDSLSFDADAFGNYTSETKNYAITLNGGLLSVNVGEQSWMLGDHEYSVQKFVFGENAGVLDVKTDVADNPNFFAIATTGQNASFTRIGNGNFLICSPDPAQASVFNKVTLQEGQTQFDDSVVFNELNVEGGQVWFNGAETVVNDKLALSNSGIAYFNGDLRVKGDATFDAGAAVLFSGESVFEKRVSVSNASLYPNNALYEGGLSIKTEGIASTAVEFLSPDSAVTIQDSFSIQGDQTYGDLFLYYFGYLQPNAVMLSKSKIDFQLAEGEKINLGDYSFLALGSQENEYNGAVINFASATASVTGYASGLKTDVEFRAGGMLTYGDVVDPLVAQNDNQVTVTYDEYQKATELLVNNTRQAIDNLQHTEQIVTNRIATVAVGSMPDGLYNSPYGDVCIKTFNTKQSQFGGVYDQADFNGGNFYTVGFNDESESGDELFGEYYGNLTVHTGTAVLMNNTVFGSGTGTVQIAGGEFVAEDADMNPNYKVRSCGTLAFDRDESSTLAPTLRTFSTRFRSGKTESDIGSTLWFNARNSSGSERYQLATFDTIMLAVEKHIDGEQRLSDARIWYDGISRADSSNVGEIALYTNYLGYLEDKQLVSYDVTQILSDDDPDNDAVVTNALTGIFAKPLVNVNVVNNGLDAETGLSNLTLEVSAKNVGDYAFEQGMSAKEQELAQKLDGARLQSGDSATRFYDALYNETDATKVRQTVHNLSLLGYNMLNAQGHFGNPTSSFFGGSSVSGEAKRGQDSEFDWDDLDHNQQPRQSAIEKTTYEPKRSLWAAYTHTAVDGDAYEFGGVTTHGYQLRRDGIIGGIRRQIDATTSGGLFFGLSSPEIHSANPLEGGYGVVGSTMEMTDFQFAGHFEKVLADVWEFSVYVGGGTQSMDWERFANFGPDAGGFYRYEAEGSGNTLTATAYLSYRADVNNALTLRPTIGVDSEHSWLYGFNETATLAGAGSGNVLLNPYMDMFAQNYSYAKTYYNRNNARAGLSLAYSDPRHGLVGLTGRVFYGVKLGGDDAPELTYRSESYRWEDMASHEMGDSSLNVGGGGFMHLNPQKTLTATGDVNAIWYKNAQTFNVTGGVSYRF